MAFGPAEGTMRNLVTQMKRGLGSFHYDRIAVGLLVRIIVCTQGGNGRAEACADGFANVREQH